MRFASLFTVVLAVTNLASTGFAQNVAIDCMNEASGEFVSAVSSESMDQPGRAGDINQPNWDLMMRLNDLPSKGVDFSIEILRNSETAYQYGIYKIENSTLVPTPFGLSVNLHKNTASLFNPDTGMPLSGFNCSYKIKP